MDKKIRENAALFIKENNIKEHSFAEYRKAAENLGYTIIFFDSILNDSDTQTLIDALELNERTGISKGFTFADSEFRLLFINEALSEKEKNIIITHELGHIVLEHMTKNNVIGNDVKEEFEANEFSHYLLSAKGRLKAHVRLSKSKIIAICVAALLLVTGITVTAVVLNRNTGYGEYYVTQTGEKYHRKDCYFVKNKNNIRRLTEEEYKNHTYEPCKICLSDEQ